MLTGSLYVVNRSWELHSVKEGPTFGDPEVAKVPGGSVALAIDERRGPYGRYVVLVLCCGALGWIYFDQLEDAE